MVHSSDQLFLVEAPLCMQDNDVERETTLNRDHLDYLVEESWRWLLSCKPFLCCMTKCIVLSGLSYAV